MTAQRHSCRSRSSASLLVAVREAARRLHGARLRGRGDDRAEGLGPIERLIYRVLRIDPKRGDDLEDVRRRGAPLQRRGLPRSSTCSSACRARSRRTPQALAAVSPDSSFNTAVSFATNTNWQGYGGESTLSYLTQMLGLTVQNFVSAATGMAVARRAHPRLLAQDDVDARQLLGRSRANARSTSSLPLSIVWRLVLVSQGVVQTFGPYATATLLEATKDADGKAVTDQVLARRPRGVAGRPSSSSARTAAASSTSTRRTRSRTRRRSRTSSRCSRSS